MILAAGLLVLIGLGLFGGGLVTGLTALYWGCVAACALAAVLLVLARSGMAREAADFAARAPEAPRHPREAGRRVPEDPATPPRGQAALPDPVPPRWEEAPVDEPEPDDEPSTGAHAAVARTTTPDVGADGEPAEEDVEVTDLLLVVDLRDDVLVVDEHPRYHLAGCPHLGGRTAVPLPMVEARADGFTPCAVCRPVRHAAETERARRRTARG
ncbi:hypothetical protein ACI79D_17420 [Geodermatophilus sp. SYSU D00708]